MIRDLDPNEYDQVGTHSRAASHYTRLADQVESMDHHRALLRVALYCAAGASFLIFLASLA